MTILDNDDIYRAIMGHIGSPVIDCSCGRTCFAGDDGLMNEGELDRLIAAAKDNPKGYHQCPDYDTVSGVILCGKTMVCGCPCNWEERIAAIIDEHV